MNVVITTFTYFPNKDGVAEATRLMAEGLARLGNNITVTTGSLDARASCSLLPEKINGVTVQRFDLAPNMGNDPEVDRYQTYIRDGQFDVIVNQCWEVWPTTYLQPIFSQLKSLKIMVSHGYSLQTYRWSPNWGMGFGQWLRGLSWTLLNLPSMVKRYDRLIFLSDRKDFGRFFDHAVAKVLRHPGIVVIPNATDPDNFPSTDEGFRDRYTVGNGLMFLCVANYCDRKDQKLTIKSFRKANLPNSTLVLIGSQLNEYSDEALAIDDQWAAKNGNGRVIFLSGLSREETFASFVACDIFLLTAKAETQPIVLIEAMTAGKPWVSTGTGCLAEMEGGMVCKNRRRLPKVLTLLAHDPEKRVSLGEEGKQAANIKYNADRNVLKFDQVIKSLASHLT